MIVAEAPAYGYGSHEPWLNRFKVKIIRRLWLHTALVLRWSSGLVVSDGPGPLLFTNM